MIRGSLDENSTYAFMFPTPDDRRAFQNRFTPGGTARSTHSNPGTITFPLWVKVERKGNQFTASYSTDGGQPVQPDTARARSDPVPERSPKHRHIGMASSHNAAAASSSSQGGATGAVASMDRGVSDRIQTAAGLYMVKRTRSVRRNHPDPAATAVPTWTQWRIAFSDLAGINLAAVKKLTIGAGDKANPKAGAAGMLYIDDIGFGHPAQ
jgi:hypothetical protein